MPRHTTLRRLLKRNAPLRRHAPAVTCHVIDARRLDADDARGRALRSEYLDGLPEGLDAYAHALMIGIPIIVSIETPIKPMHLAAYRLPS